MSKRGFTPKKQLTDTTSPPKPLASKKADFKPSPAYKLIRPAIELFKKNFPVVASVMIVPALCMALGQALISDFTQAFSAGRETTISPLVSLGGFLVSLSALWLFLMIAAPYYVLLQIIADKNPGIIATFRNSLYYALRLYGFVALFCCLVIFTGWLIFPLFIYIRRYVLAPFFLIEGNTGIRMAMQQSAAVTKPYRRSVWSVLLLGLALSTVAYGATFYLKPYGGLLLAPLSSFLLLLLALRYKELAYRVSATTIKD